MKVETKQILIGVGIGVAVSVPTTFLVTRTVSKKSFDRRHREELENTRKTAQKRGYDKGLNEGIEYSKRWIDENCIMVDANDPDAALKAIQNAGKNGPQNSEKEAKSDQNEPQNCQNDPDEPLKDDSVYAEKPETSKFASESVSKEEGTGNPTLENSQAVSIEYYKDIPGVEPEKPVPAENPGIKTVCGKIFVLNSDGTVTFGSGYRRCTYPASLFFDENGYNLSEMNIRANLMDYEANPAKLKDVWDFMGWGQYSPDPTLRPLTEEEINNMELAIDDESKEEAYQKTIERQRYLDKVEQYIANPEASPKIVPRKTFEEDHYLDHIYVDYYDVDNVFVDNTEYENEIDAYTMFGVTDGKDLFKFKHDHPFDEEDDDNDPEIVHVENFKMNTIAEITRYHKSYESVKDGSAYLDGNST